MTKQGTYYKAINFKIDNNGFLVMHEGSFRGPVIWKRLGSPLKACGDDGKKESVTK